MSNEPGYGREGNRMAEYSQFKWGFAIRSPIAIGVLIATVQLHDSLSKNTSKLTYEKIDDNKLCSPKVLVRNHSPSLQPDYTDISSWVLLFKVFYNFVL